MNGKSEDIKKEVKDGLITLKYLDGIEIIDTPASCKRADKLSDSTKDKVMMILVSEGELSRHDFDYQKERHTIELTKILRIAKMLDYWGCKNMIEYLVHLQTRRKTKVTAYLKKNGISV